jgi:hypothetical protein
MWKFPDGDNAAAARTAAPQTNWHNAPAGRNVYQQAAEMYSSAAA